MTSSLTTALTIIGSFGAASFGQIVSHILTQKRENKKFKKECLQNLYSPVIFKVINFIESLDLSDFARFKKESVDPEILFDTIMNEIGNNLKYAEPNLINFYQEVREDLDEYKFQSAPIYTDEKREEILIDWRLSHIIQLINLFFEDYIKINKKLKSDVNPITEKLKPYYFFCNFYLLSKECSPFAPIESKEILKLYDLIVIGFYHRKDDLERILGIRKELSSLLYSEQAYVEGCVNAYQYLIEFTDQFSDHNKDRADKFKELLTNNYKREEKA